MLLEMLIFGTSARHKKIDEGEFFCPHCQTQRHYELKKSKMYFSLYFIPLIPFKDIGEFVECQTCRSMFDPQVLSAEPIKRKRPVTLADMLNDLKPRLEGGEPIEYVIRDLNVAGLDRDIAKANVDAVIGTARNTCPNDGLTYAANVATCAECAAPLQPA